MRNPHFRFGEFTDRFTEKYDIGLKNPSALCTRYHRTAAAPGHGFFPPVQIQTFQMMKGIIHAGRGPVRAMQLGKPG